MLVLAPSAVQGQGTATVSVDASIVTATELSITLCDQTADFGIDLDYLGTLPTAGSTTDVIFATEPGDSTQNQGVFYGWTPTCSGGASFMQVESSIPWRATLCADESTSSSSLKIGNADLRFSPMKATTYEQGIGFTQVRTCDNPAALINSLPSGTHNLSYYLYLQVDRNDTPGTFNTTTTWSVTP